MWSYLPYYFKVITVIRLRCLYCNSYSHSSFSFYRFCSAVSWNDTSSSYKAVLLTGPIVRFLAAEELLTSSIASNVLLAVLQGLQVHGQHETNQVRSSFAFATRLQLIHAD